MKKIILFFLMFFVAETISAQYQYVYITGLNITQLDAWQLKVNLKAESLSLSTYNSYETEINGNVVTLKVCFNIYFAAMGSEHDKEFFVDIPDNPGNYTFKVEIYAAEIGVCIYDDVHLQDTATLEYTNPFTGTIYLSDNDVQVNGKDLKIYPNPSNGILNIEASTKPEKVSVFDASGKKVFQAENPGKQINVSHLQNGVYYLEVIANRDKIRKKLIIRK